MGPRGTAHDMPQTTHPHPHPHPCSSSPRLRAVRAVAAAQPGVRIDATRALRCLRGRSSTGRSFNCGNPSEVVFGSSCCKLQVRVTVSLPRIALTITRTRTLHLSPMHPLASRDWVSSHARHSLLPAPSAAGWEGGAQSIVSSDRVRRGCTASLPCRNVMPLQRGSSSPCHCCCHSDRSLPRCSTPRPRWWGYLSVAGWRHCWGTSR